MLVANLGRNVHVLKVVLQRQLIVLLQKVGASQAVVCLCREPCGEGKEEGKGGKKVRKSGLGTYIKENGAAQVRNPGSSDAHLSLSGLVAGLARHGQALAVKSVAFAKMSEGEGNGSATGRKQKGGSRVVSRATSSFASIAPDGLCVLCESRVGVSKVAARASFGRLHRGG